MPRRNPPLFFPQEAITLVNGLTQVIAKQYLNSYEELRQKAARRIFAQLVQTTTDAVAELEETAGETIADCSSTEGTWVVGSALDEAAMRGAVITVTYKDNNGTLKHAQATLNGADSSTEVAFSPAISDGYALVSMSSNTTPAAQNVTMGPTGARTIGTIATSASSATEANMHGIGDLYGWSDTTDNAYDGYGLTVEYVTPWGEIKTATCTYNTTDTTTATRFFDATDTTVTVKDFCRMRQLVSSVAVQAGDDVEVGNSAKTSIYGAIPETNKARIFTRYFAPRAADAGQCYIGRVTLNLTLATAVCTLYCTYTPVGETVSRKMSWTWNGLQPLQFDLCLPVKALSEVKWEIEDDNAAHPVAFFTVDYIEVAG